MRILHTSDWHIGKKLEGRSRLDEQIEVLNEIVSICDEKMVELVVIAGDIFDTFTPSAEAEGAFFDCLSKLANGKRIVIVISGNHDDCVRLNASSAVSKNSDVYFADSEILSYNHQKLSSGIRMLQVGKGYYVVENDSEKLFIGTLSYPTELRLKEKINDEETYQQKVERWIRERFDNNVDNLPEMLISHLFMLGGEKTQSERDIDLGGARIVDKTCIPENCIYTALGHLHKKQVVENARNIVYCGSIMQYSFDETKIDKSVNVFEVINGKVQNFETIKLSKGKQLFRINASSLEQAESLIVEDGFYELTLNLSSPLDRAEHKDFCFRHPNVFIKIAFSGLTEYTSERRNMSDKELFVEFYKKKYATTPSEELVSKFIELIDQIEVNNETN